MNTQTKLEEAILNGEDTAKLREQLNQEQRAEATEQQKAVQKAQAEKARIEQDYRQRAEQEIAGIREQILNECREIVHGFESEISLPTGLLIECYRGENRHAEVVAQRAAIEQQIHEIDGRIAALESDKAALAEARRSGSLDESVIVGKLGLATMDIDDLTDMKARLTASLAAIQTPQAINRRYFDDALKQARLSALYDAVNLAETRLVAGAQKLKAEAGTNIYWRWKPCLAVSSACQTGVF